LGAACAEEEKDYILYVHGYNMQEFEKQRWIETTTSALASWLQRSRGSFTWPCAQSGIPVPPYDPSEEKAWQSAAQLMALLSSLKTAGYHVHVLAHSQGNVVAGEALRQWKDAAIPMRSCEPTSLRKLRSKRTATIPMRHSFLDSTGPRLIWHTQLYLTYPVTNDAYMSVAAMSGCPTVSEILKTPTTMR